jgi:hypothetical protein
MSVAIFAVIFKWTVTVTEHSKAATKEHLKTGHSGSGVVSIKQIPS